MTASPRVFRRVSKSAAAAVTLAGVFVFASDSVHTAQSQDAAAADPRLTLAEQADCLAFGAGRTARHARTGTVRAVTTEAGRPIRHPRPLDALAGPEAAARSYLAVCKTLFALRDDGDLRVTRQDQVVRMSGNARAIRRRTVVRFQQSHRGVPIIGGELIVHLDDANNIVFAGGKTASPMDDESTTPSLTAGESRNAALDVVARTHNIARQRLVTSAPELWIYDPVLIGPESGSPRLVWRVEVTPRDLSPIRELVLVDARRGDIALHFNQVDTAMFRQTYTASNTAALPGALVCDETDPACSGGDVHAAAAHRYAADTYNFYSNMFGRNSIDDAGMSISSTVHYLSDYQNAFWNGTEMVYGDGSGWPLADDVVGHELTHGVTQHTSNLYYYYQSGAINESLSDVFGEFIDLTNGSGNDDPSARWLIGEDIAGLGAIRSMSNPTLYANPDRMTSPYYYAGSSDNGGVHTNSGINNKAAYLMVDGGTFNGQVVVGLGIDKAARIYYEAQTQILTSGADYADLSDALFQGCANLTGTAGITADDCEQVRKATLAVEMNVQPASPNAGSDAPLCPAGQMASNVFFDDLEGGAGNWQVNANAGTSRWLYDPPGDRGPFAHSGRHVLYADDRPAAVSDSFAMLASDVLVPANAYLHFAHAFSFDSGGSYYDGGVVEYSTNGGTTWFDSGPLFDTNGYRGTLTTLESQPLGGRAAFVGTSHGYISSRATLAAFAGQRIRFRWRMGLGSAVSDSGWWLDDVQIYTCTSPTISDDSVSPSSGSGSSQTFTLKYSDSAGATGLATAWAYFNSTFLPTANSCAVYYDRSGNTINLLNDAGTVYTSAPVGVSGVVQNSQCSIATGNTSATVAGNTLTLKLAVMFKPAFNGTKNIYMYSATASAAINSGWQQRGTWTVSTGVAAPPVVTADSATPSSGAGGTPTFALKYSDTAGATDIASAWVYFNPTFLPTSNSCVAYYNRATNAIYLLNDAGSAWTALPVGASGALQNSQCAILMGSSTTVAFGANTLTVNLAVNFTPALFAGPKNVYMYAASTTAGINSGWQQHGTWTVP